MLWSRAIGALWFFTGSSASEIYPLSLHDALPICGLTGLRLFTTGSTMPGQADWLDDPRSFPAWELAEKSNLPVRSEEHTSELQSRFDLVCRLLLEKKKQIYLFSTFNNIRGTIDAP